MYNPDDVSSPLRICGIEFHCIVRKMSTNWWPDEQPGNEDTMDGPPPNSPAHTKRLQNSRGSTAATGTSRPPTVHKKRSTKQQSKKHVVWAEPHASDELIELERRLQQEELVRVRLMLLYNNISVLFVLTCVLS